MTTHSDDDPLGGEDSADLGASDSELERALEELEQAADRLHVPAIGAVVDSRYRVVEHLGQGGFGSVYGVRHRMLDQRFAMKILNPRIAHEPNWALRFREEARATSLIGHENIVFVTDFGRCPTFGYYLVMERLDGISLHSILTNTGPQPIERVLGFALAAGSALGAVHELGIVHCDLKPSNVMWVERQGRRPIWKLLDFGTSSMVMSAVESDTLFGTPAYMAPEQALGEAVDHRTDQFSLACILYEMITGRTPWSTRRWIQATPTYRREPPTKPSHLRAECPPAVDAVLLRALELSPAYRYQNVEAFVSALQSALDVEWLPAADPFDLREEESGGFRRSLTAPTVVVESAEREGSMRIAIDEGDTERSAFDEETERERPAEVVRVQVRFATAERLRREYRRNLIAGTLFLPGDHGIPLRTTVVVELYYEPDDKAIELIGVVVSHGEGSQLQGLGVAFTPESQAALQRFLDKLSLTLIYQQDLLVRRCASAEPQPGDLSAGESFLLSRVHGTTSVGRLRALCAGLPFEVDDTVASLVDDGWLEIEEVHLASPTVVDDEEIRCRVGQLAEVSIFDMEPDTIDVTSEAAAVVTMSAEEIARVLEVVAQFRERNNYLGAIDVLRRASEMAPGIAPFHVLLAELHIDFTGDLERARSAVQRALAIDPDHPAATTLDARLGTIGG